MAYHITNNILIGRPGSPPIFTLRTDGEVDVELDRYVIVPFERYGEPIGELWPGLVVPPVAVEPEEMLEWDVI